MFSLLFFVLIKKNIRIKIIFVTYIHNIIYFMRADLKIIPPYKRCYIGMACLITARFTFMDNLCNSTHSQVNPLSPECIYKLHLFLDFLKCHGPIKLEIVHPYVASLSTWTTSILAAQSTAGCSAALQWHDFGVCEHLCDIFTIMFSSRAVISFHIAMA